jgi:hypothetical protein
VQNLDTSAALNVTMDPTVRSALMTVRDTFLPPLASSVVI